MNLGFPFFSELPLELRLQIWHEALHLFRRVIEVDPGEHPYSPGSPFTITVTPPFAPVLLQINREPRTELLPIFRNLFSHRWTFVPHYHNLLVDLSNDILFIKLRTQMMLVPTLADGRIVPLFRKIFWAHVDEVVSRLESLAVNHAF